MNEQLLCRNRLVASVCMSSMLLLALSMCLLFGTPISDFTDTVLLEQAQIKRTTIIDNVTAGLKGALSGWIEDPGSSIGRRPPVWIGVQTSHGAVSLSGGFQYDYSSADYSSADESILKANGSNLTASIISATFPKVPVYHDQVIPMGSATKLFTAAAIMQMYDKGKIKSLHDPIYTYIDGFLYRSINETMTSLYGPKAQKITFWHLLTMTSGLGTPPAQINNTQDSLFYIIDHPNLEAKDLDITPADKDPLVMLRVVRLNHEPGTKTSYNEYNHILLGAALAVLSGKQTWHEYDQRDAIPPHLRAEFPKTQFCKYQKYGDLTSYDLHFPYPPWRLANVNCTASWTAGNIFTSAAEVAHFIHELLSPNGRILTPETRQLYFSTKPTFYGGLGQQRAYGLGIQWYLPKTFFGNATILGVQDGMGHWGNVLGISSMVAYFPGVDATISATCGEIQLEHSTHKGFIQAWQDFWRSYAGNVRVWENAKLSNFKAPSTNAPAHYLLNQATHMVDMVLENAMHAPNRGTMRYFMGAFD